MYFLIFSFFLLFYYSWDSDPPLPFEELSFEELSSEDLTFVELDRDKFVLQFDELDPNSEEGEPPSLPDKNSEDYKLKLYEDQVHLTNALKTFKIAKTTHGMTKDILKEIGDKTFKGVNVKCGLLSSGCGIGNLSACVWGAVCAVLLPVLILSLSFGYYSVLVAYHLTNITYESMAITKNKYDKQTHKNQYKSDKWISYSLSSMNNNMYDEYIKLNENIFQQNRIMNDHIFQQNYILNHNINAQHTTITNNMNSQHDTILTNMNNQHTTINTNMVTQHNEMRDTLQRRHFDMTIEINTYTKCATNHILYETTEAIAAAHQITNDTPSPTPACIEALNLPSSSRRRLAEGNEEEGVNEVRLTLPEGYKTTIDIYKEVDTVEENEEEIKAWARAIKETLDNISKKLDIDPAVLDPMNDSKSKKSKKAKGEKETAQEEAAQETKDLFNRNLIAVEGVKDKFNDMKNQVKMVESQGKSVQSQVEAIATTKDDVKDMKSKVESMEGKVESIEGKVESIEKTMEELKDMLSQLMMRGADVA